MSGLIFSLLAAYISPSTIWWLALFGLAFGPLFLCNIFFFFYWIIMRRKRAFVVLFLIVISFTRIPGMFRLNLGSEIKADSVMAENSFKVMSFNVRLFNLYNWFHNTETKNMIFDFLAKESPDVICFQEFYSSDKKGSDLRNDIKLRELLSAYSHIEYTLTLRNTDHWGIATYSKFPIIRKRSVHFQEQGGNIFIYTDIVKGNDTIRVFNTHLESVRFKWEDYKFIENLGNDEVQQDELDGGLKILRRLKRAYVKRADQVNVLHDTIQASPYPVLLCGDFNDTPSSFAYSILGKDLKDAFKESGRGFGTTYAGPFPSFRIDYIFHSEKLQTFNYKTHKEDLSDHYAISCMVKLPD
ncbi:MAG TPA: endonuclease/exonuclease/phosphatase family protein [Bacteroidia bacterium]|nr:endonuclease/exonuclease/phosphatase family protein [Bacteroidia bacterium]